MLPTAKDGQYTILNCKPPLFSFPCKWWYINVYLLIYLNILSKQ